MMEYLNTDSVRLSKDGHRVEIIDQTLLPAEKRVLSLTCCEEMYEAIRLLRVRGAPAIGIFAAYSMYVLSLHADGSQVERLSRLRKEGSRLISSRPTAVDLRHAVERQLAAAEKAENIPAALLSEAEKIHKESIESCLAIAENSLSLLHDGDGILTHCNAGALATSRLGTGLGALLLSKDRGVSLHAYVDETRPLLQGARLTAYELQSAGIPCHLICDNMAAYLMQQGKINAVIVGCDRVAANGDTANKIGTLSAAVNAHHFGIPFYVCCPSSTLDPGCRSGSDIPIEERDPGEITSLYFDRQIAPEGISCCNPAFDVTPAELITAIVTEKCVYRYPYDFS